MLRLYYNSIVTSINITIAMSLEIKLDVFHVFYWRYDIASRDEMEVYKPSFVAFGKWLS